MMSYLKLQVADALKLPWLRASMQARGALITLLLYCCTQENDGVIENCEAWTDAEWQDLLRITRVDVEAVLATDLAWWNEDGGLVLGMYDCEGQRALETRRAQGRHGVKGASHGVKGGRPKKKVNPHKGAPIRGIVEKPPQNPHMQPPHTTPHQCGDVSPKGSPPPAPLGLVAQGPEPKAVQKKPMDLRALMVSREKLA